MTNARVTVEGVKVRTRFDTEEDARHFVQFTNDFTSWSGTRSVRGDYKVVTIVAGESDFDENDKEGCPDAIEEYCQRYLKIAKIV